MNFKNGHLPNTKGNHLCKCISLIGKCKNFWYEVIYFDLKQKRWLTQYKVIGWVRIREE